jgi:hypothetical protein
MLEQLSLKNLAEGTLEERFHHAMRQVIRNIEDAAMKDGKRQILISVDISPDKNRSGFSHETTVTTKLQPEMSVVGQAYLERAQDGPRKGEIIAVQHEAPEPLSNIMSNLGEG